MNLISTVSIFAMALLCLSSPVQADEIVVNAVGDVMLAGRWSHQLKKRGYGYPFAAVAAELKSADVTIANLESPLAQGGTEFTGKKFRFRADPLVATALKGAGINLVTLANNHSMDFGGEALAETMMHLDSAGIAWVGAGENLDAARRMVLYTIKGKKVAFLGYSLTQPTAFFAGRNRPGTAPGFEKFYTEDIRQARGVADFVIVSFHWGTEGKREIQAYQRSAAHKAIDAGADVIIGHHPHVLRGIERYRNGIILYSLGNFAFAGKGRTADTSTIVRLRFGDGKREAELLPLDVQHRRVGFQPRLLAGGHAAAVIGQLNELSSPFNTRIDSKDGRYLVSF